MNLKKIVKTFAISMLLAVTSTTANAQDLLARQAPVDRKMAAVDTIMLRNITMREELESPSADLYANWDNKYAHRATELPETYKIDLRHFTMPTTSRVITSNFGSRWGRQHKGLDIKVYIGDTIRAAFSGKVRIVRYEAGGDLEGTQQSGIAFDLKIADIARDGQIMTIAREEAQKIIDADPTCTSSEYAMLWRRLRELRDTNVNWAAIS